MDLSRRVKLTQDGKRFAWSPASPYSNNDDHRDLEALLMELRVLRAHHHPVVLSLAVDALTTKLAALGPNGSPKRRVTWASAIAGAPLLFEWAVRARYIEVVEGDV